jgi:hypothetical protein
VKLSRCGRAWLLDRAGLGEESVKAANGLARDWHADLVEEVGEIDPLGVRPRPTLELAFFDLSTWTGGSHFGSVGLGSVSTQ